jgi:catechol 2,3-dioxygenase-like lactoylglutathione lyase family enzyme
MLRLSRPGSGKPFCKVRPWRHVKLVRMTSRSPAPPFALKGIEHVLLLVQGMDSALAFYEDVLGARLETRIRRYAMAELRAGASHIDLVDTSAPEGAWARPPVEGGRNVDHFAMRLDSCEAAAVRQHLVACGATVVEERLSEEPDGEKLSFYVRDPSGNLVELMGARR